MMIVTVKEHLLSVFGLWAVQIKCNPCWVGKAVIPVLLSTLHSDYVELLLHAY
jgi:hypothetical protein